jgi:phage gp29-like protein
VRLNYGADVAVPQISLVPDETLDMAVLSKSVSELVSAGAPISLAWVLKKLGAPMPKPGEFIIGNAQPAQIAMPEQSKPKKRIPVRVITNRMAA